MTKLIIKNQVILLTASVSFLAIMPPIFVCLLKSECSFRKKIIKCMDIWKKVYLLDGTLMRKLCAGGTPEESGGTEAHDGC